MSSDFDQGRIDARLSAIEATVWRIEKEVQTLLTFRAYLLSLVTIVSVAVGLVVNWFRPFH